MHYRTLDPSYSRSGTPSSGARGVSSESGPAASSTALPTSSQYLALLSEAAAYHLSRVQQFSPSAAATGAPAATATLQRAPPTTSTVTPLSREHRRFSSPAAGVAERVPTDARPTQNAASVNYQPSPHVAVTSSPSYTSTGPYRSAPGASLLFRSQQDERLSVPPTAVLAPPTTTDRWSAPTTVDAPPSRLRRPASFVGDAAASTASPSLSQTPQSAACLAASLWRSDRALPPASVSPINSGLDSMARRRDTVATSVFAGRLGASATPAMPAHGARFAAGASAASLLDADGSPGRWTDADSDNDTTACDRSSNASAARFGSGSSRGHGDPSDVGAHATPTHLDDIRHRVVLAQIAAAPPLRPLSGVVPSARSSPATPAMPTPRAAHFSGAPLGTGSGSGTPTNPSLRAPLSTAMPVDQPPFSDPSTAVLLRPAASATGPLSPPPERVPHPREKAQHRALASPSASEPHVRSATPPRGLPSPLQSVPPLAGADGRGSAAAGGVAPPLRDRAMGSRPMPPPTPSQQEAQQHAPKPDQRAATAGASGRPKSPAELPPQPRHQPSQQSPSRTRAPTTEPEPASDGGVPSETRAGPPKPVDTAGGTSKEISTRDGGASQATASIDSSAPAGSSPKVGSQTPVLLSPSSHQYAAVLAALVEDASDNDADGCAGKGQLQRLVSARVDVLDSESSAEAETAPTPPTARGVAGAAPAALSLRVEHPRQSRSQQGATVRAVGVSTTRSDNGSDTEGLLWPHEAARSVLNASSAFVPLRAFSADKVGAGASDDSFALALHRPATRSPHRRSDTAFAAGSSPGVGSDVGTAALSPLRASNRLDPAASLHAFAVAAAAGGFGGFGALASFAAGHGNVAGGGGTGDGGTSSGLGFGAGGGSPHHPTAAAAKALLLAYSDSSSALAAAAAATIAEDCGGGTPPERGRGGTSGPFSQPFRYFHPPPPPPRAAASIEHHSESLVTASSAATLGDQTSNSMNVPNQRARLSANSTSPKNSRTLTWPGDGGDANATWASMPRPQNASPGLNTSGGDNRGCLSDGYSSSPPVRNQVGAPALGIAALRMPSLHDDSFLGTDFANAAAVARARLAEVRGALALRTLLQTERGLRAELVDARDCLVDRAAVVLDELCTRGRIVFASDAARYTAAVDFGRRIQRAAHRQRQCGRVVSEEAVGRARLMRVWTDGVASAVLVWESLQRTWPWRASLLAQQNAARAAIAATETDARCGGLWRRFSEVSEAHRRREFLLGSSRGPSSHEEEEEDPAGENWNATPGWSRGGARASLPHRNVFSPCQVSVADGRCVAGAAAANSWLASALGTSVDALSVGNGAASEQQTRQQTRVPTARSLGASPLEGGVSIRIPATLLLPSRNPAISAPARPRRATLPTGTPDRTGTGAAWIDSFAWAAPWAAAWSTTHRDACDHASDDDDDDGADDTCDEVRPGCLTLQIPTVAVYFAVVRPVLSLMLRAAAARGELCRQRASFAAAAFARAAELRSKAFDDRAVATAAAESHGRAAVVAAETLGGISVAEMWARGSVRSAEENSFASAHMLWIAEAPRRRAFARAFVATATNAVVRNLDAGSHGGASSVDAAAPIAEFATASSAAPRAAQRPALPEAMPPSELSPDDLFALADVRGAGRVPLVSAGAALRLAGSGAATGGRGADIAAVADAYRRAAGPSAVEQSRGLDAAGFRALCAFLRSDSAEASASGDRAGGHTRGDPLAVHGSRPQRHPPLPAEARGVLTPLPTAHHPGSLLPRAAASPLRRVRIAAPPVRSSESPAASSTRLSAPVSWSPRPQEEGQDVLSRTSTAAADRAQPRVQRSPPRVPVRQEPPGMFRPTGSGAPLRADARGRFPAALSVEQRAQCSALFRRAHSFDSGGGGGGDGDGSRAAETERSEATATGDASPFAVAALLRQTGLLCREGLDGADGAPLTAAHLRHALRACGGPSVVTALDADVGASDSFARTRCITLEAFERLMAAVLFDGGCFD